MKLSEKEWFKKLHVKYFIIIFFFYCLKGVLYETSKNVSTNYHFIDMEIDNLIPFCKYFILFYITYYFSPPIQLYYISYKDKNKFYRLVISGVISVIIANICFLCYQTKFIRPVVEGSDIFSVLVRYIYTIDNGAVNCFPSIHAIFGMLMIIGGCNTKGTNIWYKLLTITVGLGCIVSTVFVKQHYFIDMVAGVLLILVVYGCVLLAEKKLRNKVEQTEIK